MFVIDDDLDTLALVSGFLRKAGYTVRTARNGHDALALLQWIEPAMILLDVHMPIMDGFAFRDAQRQHTLWSRIPTILITADLGAETVDNLPLLRKPLQLDELIALALRFCRRADA